MEPLKKISFAIAICLTIISSCKKEEQKAPIVESANSSESSDLRNAASLILPQSDHFDSIPQDPRNPLTAAKVELGKLLFHETRLAGAPKFSEGLYTYSCATCHHAEAGFQSGLAQSLGEGGFGFGVTGEARIPSPTYPLKSVDASAIRSPSVLNTAYQEVTLWNGGLGSTGVNATTQSSWTGPTFSNNFLGYQGLETLGFAAIQKHHLFVDTAWFSNNTEYKNLFDAAFPDTAAANRISITTVSLAIAAYERTVLANQAPFQRWLRGDKKALTADENAGRQLFFGKAKCDLCHNGPALNSIAFYALGMNDLQEGVNGAVNVSSNAIENKGRGGFTNVKRDMFKFKVPQLYNLKDVHYFGHGSSFTSVEQVVRYLNAAVPQNPNVPVERLPKQFVPLGLTDTEISQLVKFIEDGLYDPNLSRYVPSSVPSGNCIPNNDTQSKIDRGCQ